MVTGSGPTAVGLFEELDEGEALDRLYESCPQAIATAPSAGAAVLAVDP